MEINYFMVGMLIFMTWVVLYSIVTRICKCIETKELYRALGNYLTSTNASDNISKLPDVFNKLIKVTTENKE